MKQQHNEIGKLFIISAPSGAGKSSLLQALRKYRPDLLISISHTTRPLRSNERHGVHYYFVDRATFMAMVGRGEFLEHAQVFDNFYGTSEAVVRENLRLGHNVILEIDWQGATQVRKLFPDVCSIFIVPPSLMALRERLSNRAQDSSIVIERRMRDAQQELSHYPEYDYLVVNDNFEQAVNDLNSIITAQELRIEQQIVNLSHVLKNLLN